MPSQDERVHEVTSPLSPLASGEPSLILRKMKAKEEISRPFEYEVDMLSELDDIDPNDLLGEPMGVTISMPDDNRKRHFHGLVASFTYLGRAEGNSMYRAVLRPWIWFLSHNYDCRIFQEKTAIDIFEAVCRETHGFSDFNLQLNESYRQREYCVQYRESDLGFVSRLLEEEGVSYYFKHEENKHTMVLVDSNSAFPDISGEKQIPYRAPGEAQTSQEHVSVWRSGQDVQTGAFVLDDYDFTKPRVDLEGSASVSRSHSKSEYERYDYPGLHWETADGEALARRRIEELQSKHRRFSGLADHRGLTTGGAFELVEYTRDSENGEYVIVAAEIEIESAEIENLRTGAENRFEVKFEAIHKDEPFRPERRIPKPTVLGPQTAVVTGKAGEEIWTDEYGRVKVQFHWDREGQMDENTSCWIRVSQIWAGKQWGAIHIPRIGQEVVVDFLEGDPDRPLITGRVYNDALMPPYPLPDNQTQSGIISRSTKDGTNENFNELRFEDKAGEEEIYFHAEKNFKRVVENDDILEVGLEKQDPGSQTVTVHGDRTVEIKTGNDAETVAQGNQAITISQGNHTLDISAGKSDITAAQKITLKVGSSKIEISPTGITLSAVQIKIEGTAQTEMKAPTTTVKGDGMLTLKGGMTMIN